MKGDQDAIAFACSLDAPAVITDLLVQTASSSSKHPYAVALLKRSTEALMALAWSSQGRRACLRVDATNAVSVLLEHTEADVVAEALGALRDIENLHSRFYCLEPGAIIEAVCKALRAHPAHEKVVEQSFMILSGLSLNDFQCPCCCRRRPTPPRRAEIPSHPTVWISHPTRPAAGSTNSTSTCLRRSRALGGASPWTSLITAALVAPARPALSSQSVMGCLQLPKLCRHNWPRQDPA